MHRKKEDPELRALRKNAIVSKKSAQVKRDLSRIFGPQELTQQMEESDYESDNVSVAESSTESEPAKQPNDSPSIASPLAPPPITTPPVAPPPITTAPPAPPQLVNISTSVPEPSAESVKLKPAEMMSNAAEIPMPNVRLEQLYSRIDALERRLNSSVDLIKAAASKTNKRRHDIRHLPSIKTPISKNILSIERSLERARWEKR